MKETFKEVIDTECITLYEPEVNGSYFLLAKTECKRIPQTLCGARTCNIVSGPEKCYNQTIITVSDVPEETWFLRRPADMCTACYPSYSLKNSARTYQVKCVHMDYMEITQ